MLQTSNWVEISDLNQIEVLELNLKCLKPINWELKNNWFQTEFCVLDFNIYSHFELLVLAILETI